MKVIQISLDNDMKTGTRGNLEFRWYEAMILSLLPCGVPRSKDYERGWQGVGVRWSCLSEARATSYLKKPCMIQSWLASRVPSHTLCISAVSCNILGGRGASGELLLEWRKTEHKQRAGFRRSKVLRQRLLPATRASPKAGPQEPQGTLGTREPGDRLHYQQSAQLCTKSLPS